MSRGTALLLACAACGGDGEPQNRPRTFGGDRPVTLQIPSEIDPAVRYPLVLILHGYGANGFLQQAFFGLSGEADRRAVFTLAPDGLIDSNDMQFWNADPACCDFDGTNPDDVGYLGGLVDDVMASWPVDPGAVFVIGHSNGGFMSYRLACERADLFAGMVSLAGNASTVTCDPSMPVNVLHLHGTMDGTVPFSGAVPSVEQWADHDGCSALRVPGPDLDLEQVLPGAETRTETATDCPEGGEVALWSIEGGSHIPSLGPAFEPTLWQWFTDHVRP
ncbi:MAG: alpha/beta hydrolase-fold protein [Kofleriaceae bacterium]